VAVLVVALVALLYTSDAASAPRLHSNSIQLQTKQAPLTAGAGCSVCIQLSDQALNILLNYVLNAGVVGGCSAICGHLNNTFERDACTVVCTIAGVKEFVKAIENADLDPIYFCELTHSCEAGSDSASAKPVSVAAIPQSGAPGTKFELDFMFQVINATGVGEIAVAIDGPVSEPVGGSFVNTGYAAGNYEAKVSIDTQGDPDADPPVIWSPGVYTATFELCQGECGSKHPHSIVFGRISTNFTLQ